MPMCSVFCHLSHHLVSCHVLFHQVSPSQLRSSSIPLSSYCHLLYVLRCLILISPFHMSKPSTSPLSEEFCHRVHYVSLFRCLHFLHGLVASFFLPTTTCNFSCVQFPLLLSSYPTFCSIRHGRFYVLSFPLQTKCHWYAMPISF